MHRDLQVPRARKSKWGDLWHDQFRRFAPSWANRHQSGCPEVGKMNQPLKKYKAGQVSCAIWENQATVNGKQVTMLKASVERRFKGKDGNWKSSSSFGRNEIPLAIYCLNQAFNAIVEEQQNSDTEEELVQ